jgi:hypothetical protein
MAQMPRDRPASAASADNAGPSGEHPADGRPAGDGTGPIVCVDLNGVLDSYTGWRSADHFDPPRAGAREFLDALRARGYRIVVFTTRYRDDVWAWLRAHGLDPLISDVTDRKPPAHVFVDDRAVCFRGDFGSTLNEIDAFAAHWEVHDAVHDAPTRDSP